MAAAKDPKESASETEEELIVCPYDKNHLLQGKKLWSHIKNRCRPRYVRDCEQRKMDVPKITCRYNPIHVIVCRELDLHEKYCVDKDTPKKVMEEMQKFYATKVVKQDQAGPSMAKGDSSKSSKSRAQPLPDYVLKALGCAAGSTADDKKDDDDEDDDEENWKLADGIDGVESRTFRSSLNKLPPAYGKAAKKLRDLKASIEAREHIKFVPWGHKVSFEPPESTKPFVDPEMEVMMQQPGWDWDM